MLPGRTGKQCRERWCNNLDPSLKKGAWTAEEDHTILQMHAELGTRWAEIAKSLPGRRWPAVLPMDTFRMFAMLTSISLFAATIQLRIAGTRLAVECYAKAVRPLSRVHLMRSGKGRCLHARRTLIATSRSSNLTRSVCAAPIRRHLRCHDPSHRGRCFSAIESARIPARHPKRSASRGIQTFRALRV